MKNVMEYLDISASRYPNKVFIGERDSQTSFKTFAENTKRIASFLLLNSFRDAPVMVLADKGSPCLEMALGAVRAGCFYTIADSKAPPLRLNKIISIFKPAVILCDKNNRSYALSLCGGSSVYCYDDAVAEQINEQELMKTQTRQTDSDVLYVLFTSGSTGTPKGVTITHRAVLSYSDWVTNEFGFNMHTVFGNQTPFYFSMSVTDIFSAMKCASTIEIIPKQLFTFPKELVEYMNKKNINTIYWVPTALGIIANFKAFSVIKPKYLKTVLFAGEVMPTRQLLYWQDELGSDVEYANLFGPTETTDICTFFRVNRRLEPDESVPIGKPCENCKILIVDENKQLSNSGEIYAGGSFLANGYYGNDEKTKEAFVQNPLNNTYPEIMYRTGDLARINKYGEIEYAGRRDFQIKHLGYRIELGEIEINLASVESVKNLVCVYDSDSDKIFCVFEGKKSTKDELINKAENALVTYMHPDVYCRMRQLPTNANGKIDRRKILEEMKKGE